MAFDGSGIFLRLRSWIADATAGVKIRADFHDDEDNNFADGLSQCIVKDGQTTITQNIPFNSKRVTALADPVDAQDAATKAYADTKLSKVGDGTITGNVDVTGNITTTGDITAGGKISATGYRTRKGLPGPYGGSYFNFDWTGNLEAWVDNTNIGTLATQAYVTTAASNKVDRTGDTMTGNLTVIGTVNVRSTAGINFQDSGGIARGSVFWNPNDNTTALIHASSPVGVSIAANGMVFLGKGWRCKGGFSGAYGTVCSNLYWEPGVGMHLYADDMHQGVIAYTSDYRLKKDVADLPDTWDIVKALRPVKYTQAAYGKTVDGDDMFTADDVERWGFIAHELQETMIPTAATGVKDQENLVQSPNPWTIIAALTRTVQELQARVEALESEPAP